MSLESACDNNENKVAPDNVDTFPFLPGLTFLQDKRITLPLKIQTHY